MLKKMGFCAGLCMCVCVCVCVFVYSRTSPSSCTYRKAPIGVGHALFVLSDDQLTRIFHSANKALCCASQIVCVCVCVCVWMCGCGCACVCAYAYSVQLN